MNGLIVHEGQLGRDYRVIAQRQTRAHLTVLGLVETLFECMGNGASDPFKRLHESYGMRDVKTSVDALRRLEDISAARYRLWESQKSSDFPALMSELSGRMLKAKYMTASPRFRQIVPIRPTPITNFKNVHSVGVNRNDNSTTFGEPIPENGSFGYSSFSDSLESYRVKKYIEGWRASFELRMNDDLGGLSQITSYMVEDAIFVQEKFAVSLFADANGPDATLYTAARGNIIVDGGTTNPALSLSALQAGVSQITDAKDVSGRPIVFPQGLTLVVGTGSLLIQAQQILNTLEIRQTEGTDVRVSRPSLPEITIVHDPYIGSVVSTNLETSWWLFPTPTPNPTRTWAEMGFMQGFDTPQLYVKSPNTQNLAGALISEVGNFNTWSAEWAVATIFGGRTLEDYQMTVASNGTEAA